MLDRLRKRLAADVDFEFSSNKIRSLLLAVVLALALVVSGYQIYALSDHRTKLNTETALTKTIYKSITTDAYIIRNEQVISYSSAGTVVPLVGNGSKVSIGDAVAEIYRSSGQAGGATRYSSLEDEISYYEGLASLNAANLVAGIDKYNMSVTDRVLDVQKILNSGNLSELENSVRNLGEAVTKKQLAVGEEVNVSSELEKLYTSANAASQATGGCDRVTAPAAGYYVNTCDGYENAYEMTSPEEVTKDDVSMLLSLEAAPPSNGAGRLITDFNWYLVCTVSSADAGSLSVGSSVKITFQSLSSEFLTMKLKAKNQNADDSVTLVFASNLMDSEIAALRRETVKIRTEEYSGYAVNKKAVRTVDGETGVYVQLGNIVRFRKTDIIYSDDSVILVSATGDRNGYLRLYDEIIVEGAGLYDGKIIS